MNENSDAASRIGEALEHISWLADRADGWWVHCSTVGRDWQECGGRVFMPIDEWSRLYDAKDPTCQ